MIIEYMDHIRINRCEYPLNPKSLDLKRIKNNFIPINDHDLLVALSDLIYLIGNQCDWIYPDLEKTELGLFISDWTEDGEIASLYVKVHPLQYSEEEKTIIIATASDEPIFYDCADMRTEKDLWQHRFDHVDLYYQGKLTLEDAEECVILTLTHNERSIVKKIIKRYIQ